MTSMAQSIEHAFERTGRRYRDGAERPLGGYLVTMAAYAAGCAAATTAARRTGRAVPGDFDVQDVLLTGLATHKAGRLLTFDPVTSPLRAPFTRYRGTKGPSELDEEVRGHGLQHTVGELITCPFCAGQWIATVLGFGRVFAPNATRLVTGVLASLAVSDFLQFARAAAQQATER
jgi:hypothetical protein